MGNNDDKMSNDPERAETSTTVTAAQLTSVAPASNPTGMLQFNHSAITWFIEIAVPLPTPLGV